MPAALPYIDFPPYLCYIILKGGDGLLTVFLGENSSEKLRLTAESMRAHINNNESVAAIVPEQFSFAYDKALYACLGPRDFNRVNIYGFKRLAKSVFERFGAADGTLAGQNERTVLIFLALRRVKKEKSLRLLSRFAEKPAFIGEISEILDLLRRSGLSAEDVFEASEKIGGTLGDKLHDVSEIYRQYLDILNERGLRDESSEVLSASLIAAENSAFAGQYIYVDRFDGFSPDELSMLRSALMSAKEVCVSLSLPGEYPRSAVSPFNHPAATLNSLVKLCEETGTPLRYKYCRTPKTANSLLSGVGACLFTRPPRTEKADDTLRIYRADTMYDEADFVAAEIRRLVTSGGYSLNDIAVMTHDIDGFGMILEAAFSRYGVEAFTDRPRPASSMSLVLSVLDALDAASGRVPDTEKILKYLRSPFSPLTAEEISLLWDYSVRWNVAGKMWLEPFTAGNFSEVEPIRQKATAPLIKLHEACESATAADISKAFCEFLKETSLAERAFDVIEDCADPDMKLETARLFKQLWNAVMSAITSICLTAGEEKLTLKTYSELLRTVLSRASVSSPPQKLECVTVADVSRSVIDRPKVVFVIGLAEGLFPAEIRSSGLFSGNDLKKLSENGVGFDMTDEARLASERFDCYKALTAPTERLILSWSDQDRRGKSLKPSRFISRIIRYCSAEVRPISKLPLTLTCSTPAAAYYGSAVKKMSPAERASIRAALGEISEYREKLLRLSKISEGVHSLSPSVSKRLFAERDINVTASRIDVYNRCGFGYFCKYGLKIQPITPLRIDPANRGTVMHYLFENVLRHFGPGFSDVSDDDIRELVSKLLNDFSESDLGGSFGKSAKFTADFNRLGDAAVEILINMREEFKVSKFRPERFEYDLSQLSGKSAYSIPLTGGVKVNLRGIVDRIDTYTSPDGRRYLRVIDYKTGEKRFSFDDVYNGLNLQLLLYILALTEGNDPDFNDCSPAGILYMRAGFLECKSEEDSEKSRDEISAEQLKRSGLIVKNDEVISAMDENISGRFLPVKTTASGAYTKTSSLISEASFEKLLDFARLKAMRFGEDLLGGRIPAIPVGSDPEHLQCAYCDYSSVCDRRKYMMKLIEPSDGKKLEYLIGEEDGADA